MVTRRRVANFIGGREEEIVFTRGATEAINLVAYSWGDSHLKAGDRVTATQSAVVLENLIGQFLYSKAEQGGDSGGATANGGAKE